MIFLRERKLDEKENKSCLGENQSTFQFQVEVFLEYTDAGSGFLYGYLGSKEKPPFDLRSFPNKTSVAFEVISAINKSHSMNTVFIFKSLSVLYFVSFMLSMFFYLGAMQWIIGKVGWVLQVRNCHCVIDCSSLSHPLVLY